jgi:hypothetical protein
VILSRFSYRYRDANNFKVERTVLLQGSLSAVELDEINALLFDGEWFVPEQVGLPPLQAALYHFSNGPTDADHPLHEFVELAECEFPSLENGHEPFDCAALLERFRLIGGKWDHSFESTFLK